MEVSMVFLTSEMNIFRQFPSKHAGSDPEEFWLRLVVAITASVQPESARIVYATSDFPHPFQFRFSEEGMDHTVQDRPGSSLDGLVKVWPNLDGLVKVWPNLDGLVKVGPNASGPEAKPVYRNHRARFLAGCNRPATSFPLSDSVRFVHRRPG